MLPVRDRQAMGLAAGHNGSGPLTGGSGLVVRASVTIDGTAEVHYRVYEDGLAEFPIGDGEFGPLTTEPGPPELADRAQQALRATLSAALGALVGHDEGRAPQ